MVTELKMREGCYSFSNYLYNDGPITDLKWGFVKFYAHTSAYITVELFLENSNIPQFIRLIHSSDNVWMTDKWKKIVYDDSDIFNYKNKVFPAKIFKAKAHATPNQGGYMFDEDSTDTGMGSDGNGILYFSQNGVKTYLNDILKHCYEYDPSDGVIDINSCVNRGIYTFTGQVNVKNGPVSVFGDCSLFVTGKTHGFKLVIIGSYLYYQITKWDGTPDGWRKITSSSI